MQRIKYDVPIAIHLDHFEDVDAMKNIDLGFKSCMIDASKMEFEKHWDS